MIESLTKCVYGLGYNKAPPNPEWSTILESEPIIDVLENLEHVGVVVELDFLPARAMLPLDLLSYQSATDTVDAVLQVKLYSKKERNLQRNS